MFPILASPKEYHLWGGKKDDKIVLALIKQFKSPQDFYLRARTWINLSLCVLYWLKGLLTPVSPTSTWSSMPLP